MLKAATGSKSIFKSMSKVFWLKVPLIILPSILKPLSLLNETSIFLLSIDKKLSMLILSILTLKSNSFWNLSKLSSTAIDNESYFPIFKSKSRDEVTK